MLIPAVRTPRAGLHLLETEVEGFDVRSAVLMGSEQVILWDTLAHPAQMEPVGALTAGAPITVVYSHADWDHAWGTCGLDDVREVVAHRAAAARFADDVPAELARRCAADPDTWRAVRLCAPTRMFTDRLCIDAGGFALELHALAGHTADCIVGLVPEWGVLLAGDAVETPVPVVNDARALPQWAAQLQRWSDDPRVVTVIPSHGPVGGKELLDATAAYLRALASGTAPGELGSLSPFYRETHERNVSLARALTRP